MIKVRQDQGERLALVVELPDAVFGGAAVGQSGQTVGGCLALCAVECAHGADPGAGLNPQRSQLCDLAARRGFAGGPRGVQHAERPSHKAHGNTHCRDRATGPAAQARAGIKRLAVGKYHRVAPSHRHAAERRLHVTPRGTRLRFSISSTAGR